MFPLPIPSRYTPPQILKLRVFATLKVYAFTLACDFAGIANTPGICVLSSLKPSTKILVSVLFLYTYCTVTFCDTSRLFGSRTAFVSASIRMISANATSAFITGISMLFVSAVCTVSFAHADSNLTRNFVVRGIVYLSSLLLAVTGLFLFICTLCDTSGSPTGTLVQEEPFK